MFVDKCGTGSESERVWVDVLMEELLLLARFKGVATDELDSFINARLNAVNLSKVSSSAVTIFSGGLRRRVTVAHVLLVGVRVCVSGAKPETSILICKRKGHTHTSLTLHCHAASGRRRRPYLRTRTWPTADFARQPLDTACTRPQQVTAEPRFRTQNTKTAKRGGSGSVHDKERSVGGALADDFGLL